MTTRRDTTTRDLRKRFEHEGLDVFVLADAEVFIEHDSRHRERLEQIGIDELPRHRDVDRRGAFEVVSESVQRRQLCRFDNKAGW
jgi:hypothetical protein